MFCFAGSHGNTVAIWVVCLYSRILVESAPGDRFELMTDHVGILQFTSMVISL